MALAETALILLAIIVMFFSLILILIPAVPVSALEWAIAIIVGIFTNFQRVTPVAALLITLLGILGSTSSFWMPFLGLKGKELSCWGLIAFFIGLIVGSFVIPIPILGGIIGGVIAVILVQFIQVREVKTAFQSGGTALKLILLGMVAELVFAMLIVITFLVSVGSTA